MRFTFLFTPTLVGLGVAGAVLCPMNDGNIALGAQPQAVLPVKADRPLHQLAGGIGASWHAIRVQYQFDGQVRHKYDVRHETPRAAPSEPTRHWILPHGGTSTAPAVGLAWIGFAWK